LIGCGCRDQEAVLIASGETADNPRSGYRAMCDRDEICEFRFKNGVEVFRGPNRDKTVAVGEGCKNPNFVGVLKLRSSV